MESNQNFVAETVSAAKQVETLKKRISEKKSEIKNEDLQSFRELCCCEKVNIATIACDTIVHFVKHHNFPLSNAISWFLTSLQSTKNIRGIVKAITDLLILSIQRNSWESYANSSDILQHPITLILKQNEANWSIVEFQMNFIFSSLNDECVFAIFKPVFMYGLWSPSKTVDTSCKRGLWKYVIYNANVDIEFLILTLCWMRIDEDSILDTHYFLNSFLELPNLIVDHKLGYLLSVIFADTACKLAASGYNPKIYLTATKNLLKLYPAATDMILMMFARTLLSCPALYLHSFAQACVELMKSNKFSNVTIVWMVIASLLPWICQPVPLIQRLCRTSDLIFVIAENHHEAYSCESRLPILLSDKVFMQYVTSNHDVFSAFALLHKLETCSPADIIHHMNEFLVSVEDIQDNPLTSLFISGILFANEDNGVVQKCCLDILMKTNPSLQLPLILCMLSKTPCSQLQLALMCSIPRTAVNKNNIPPILSTLNSLTSNGQAVLAEISIQLHLELWKIEKRCYPYLSEQLHKHKVVSPGVNWQMDVVTAQAIRDICSMEASKYGQEWVPLLSDIMNRCSEEYNSLPLIEALDAILALCEAGVVNVLTVFKELSYQRMFHDKRAEVVAKLCELVMKIFEEITESSLDKHRATVNEALTTMWHLVTEFRHEIIATSALKALSKIDVGLMPLKVIPEDYRKDVQLPSEYLKTKNIDENAEDILPYVPGSVWIKYLENVREELKSQTCDMMSSWLQTGLSQLGRGFYRSIRGEPNDVSFLPDKSIFKALVKYLKRLVIRNNVVCSTDELRTVILCLAVLNNDSVTQIPLFNWTFLEHFFQYKNHQLTKALVKFYAKQSATSVSANKAIEHYLNLLDMSVCEAEEMEIVLSVLPKMCCHVSPNLFSAVLNPTIAVICERIKEDRDLFQMTCEHFGKTLEESGLDEHNRDAVCRSVIQLWNHISDNNNEHFESVVEIITKLPQTYIEHLLAVEEASGSDCERFGRLIKLIYLISMKDSEQNPFRWLDVSVDIAFHCYTKRELFYIYTADILRKNRLHTGKWTWILQFMDQTFKDVDENKYSDERANFMCEVLVFVIVAISSFYPIMKNAASTAECGVYFPQAVNEVAFKDISGQIIEWLYFMSRSQKIAEKYKVIFKSAIIAMKYNVHLKKIAVWSKVVSVF